MSRTSGAADHLALGDQYVDAVEDAGEAELEVVVEPVLVLLVEVERHERRIPAFHQSRDEELTDLLRLDRRVITRAELARQAGVVPRVPVQQHQAPEVV